MSTKQRIPCFKSALLTALFLSLSFAAPVKAQDDPTRLGDPNFTAAAFATAFTGPAANVYVSVRESTGLSVPTAALVKLSCPLAGVDIHGATQGANAQIQFKNVPVGDCNVEVSATGYRTAKDRTEVFASMTSRIQYLYVVLHPESESAAAAARPPVVPLGLIKEMDKAMEAMQKKRDADARKHLDKAARISPTNPDVAYLQGIMELHHHN